MKINMHCRNWDAKTHLHGMIIKYEVNSKIYDRASHVWEGKKQLVFAVRRIFIAPFSVDMRLGSPKEIEVAILHILKERAVLESSRSFAVVLATRTQILGN